MYYHDSYLCAANIAYTTQCYKKTALKKEDVLFYHLPPHALRHCLRTLSVINAPPIDRSIHII